MAATESPDNVAVGTGPSFKRNRDGIYPLRSESPPSREALFDALLQSNTNTEAFLSNNYRAGRHRRVRCCVEGAARYLGWYVGDTHLGSGCRAADGEKYGAVLPDQDHDDCCYFAIRIDGSACGNKGFESRCKTAGMAS